MDSSRRQPRTREPSGSAHPRRAPRVLLADDDDDLRTLLAVALRRDGYDVVEARSGAELLDDLGDALLHHGYFPRPDLIISDIRMDGFTGIEILAGLRGANWRTPIVLMSAFGGDDTQTEARRLGADAFFKKPIDVAQVLQKILSIAPPARG